MKELDLSIEVLNNILTNHVSFQNALKEKFQADPQIRQYRSTVAALTGCVLRHYILFSLYLKDVENISEEERAAIYIALGNEFFAKRVDSEEINKFVEDKVAPEHLEFIKGLLTKKDNPDDFIPSEIDKKSLHYLSIRFNTPEWVLKIWKHFGMAYTFKILRKNLKPFYQSVRVRESLIPTSEVLKDISFSESKVPGILFYKSKEPLRKNNFFLTQKIFLERPAMKEVLDKFALKSDNSEVLVYNGNEDDSLSLEVLETYRKRIGINIGVEDTSKHVDITRAIKQYGLGNVNFFSANPLEMEAAISNPQDLVIVHPTSTNFDLTRDNPDYLYHFDRNKMDEIIKKEEDCLEGCAKFVADQGDLLYIVSTISMKECQGQIETFLKKHEDFKLVEQKQYFPFDDNETSLYYALLHKGMDVAKNGVISNNIIVETNRVSNLASAEEH